MDSFLYVTCMNESFLKNIQPTTEQNLQEIEADDILLQRKYFQFRIFLIFFIYL